MPPHDGPASDRQTERYPTLVLTLLHAREPQEPAGRPRSDWKLITRPAAKV